jgi:peptide chain release factor 2
MAQPGFWDDPQAAQPLLQERHALEASVSLAERFHRREEEIGVLVELDQEGEPVDADLESGLRALAESLDQVEMEIMMDGENDPNNAIVAIHPGAGGIDSQDWAAMLHRMYLRWADGMGYAVRSLDLQPGEEAGIKSATFIVAGPHAYGYLKAEVGVHRLVRLSPFDASHRRHTSFASVFVYPEVDERIRVEIDEKDLRIDTYRSSGAGGQHVNVTDSAVRITHLPTGIVVQCQNERSQHRNRDMAMKVLRARLHELALAQKLEEKERAEQAKMEIKFGSQIRSYVLHPYQMAKDHRTKFEVGSVGAVLDGGLTPFIRAYLLSKARKQAEKGAGA